MTTIAGSISNFMIATAPAYVPFKMPFNAAFDWWYLLIIPLAFGIALIYKATRVADLRHIWRQTLLMTVQIVLAMVALAVALAIFILVLIPRLPVE